VQPIESLTVGDRQIDPGIFAVPEMGLSSSRQDAECHQVTVAIRPDAMVDFLTPRYEAWVAESKRDDEQIGRPFDALALAGYPSLHDLTSMPDILRDVLGSYLLADFIGQLTWNGSQPIRYWLDGFTRCEAHGGAIYLHGRCYSN
jgi:hypothetical protein